MRYVGGHVSIAGALVNSIENTKKIGGNCLQIFAGSPRLWFRKLFAETDVKTFLEEKTKNNLGPVFIHALYLVNLASDKDDLVQKSIESLVLDLKNGDQINASGVVIHIGSHQGRGFESVKDQLVENLKTIIAKTENTKLLLENDAGQNGKIGSIEELGFLISQVNSDRLGVCLDTAHLFASGFDLRDSQQTRNLIQQLVDQKIIDKVALIHLNDSATDLASGRDNHADLGVGKIGTDGLKNFVNQPELKHLPLILETPGADKMGPDENNIAIAKSF